ncbi:MAG TPA: isoprenylcysteine carboxylmethyltransferase family protein [Vicinamibacterales bacterium]|nr:isoprenylcysteine carboxylmethyltransferase family protein [Vicinamibacterales bacterium]
MASTRPTGLALIPPPLLFAATLGGGLFLSHRFPVAHVTTQVATLLRWVGAAAVVAGVGHILSSIALFVRSRTTVVPHRSSSRLVTRGAYRWTRNPMYVGLTLVYLGIAAVTTSGWMLVLLPLPLLVLQTRVIPMEERQLEAAFGGAYRDYQARVRRWL